MTLRRLAFAALALAACRSPGSSLVTEARADPPAAGATPADGTGAPVVELFTSEGCSSCPAADRVFADLAESGQPVYALAFHVDYWNDLGWPDRFSSAEYTARQRAYGRSFGASGVYTPQMIVGGLEPFVGSDRARADASIARALARPASVALSVHVRTAGADALTVDYEAPNAPPGALLNLALVERSASSTVTAGENAGRTLHHANIVRAFQAVPLSKGTGSTTLRRPPSLRGAGGELVAYVQRPPSAEGMPILGSARVALPNGSMAELSR